MESASNQSISREPTAAEFALLREDAFLQRGGAWELLLAHAKVLELPVDVLLCEQDERADSAFFLLEGEAEVSFRARHGTTQIVVRKVPPLSLFGEQALRPAATGLRNARVRMSQPGAVLVLNGRSFRSWLGENPALIEELDSLAIKQMTSILLRSLDVFQHFFLEESQMDTVKTRQCAPGEIVLQEGEPGEAAYFVLSGTALVMAPDGEDLKLLGRVTKGQCFGELSILTGAPRAARVIAEEPLSLLCVEAETFLKWYEAHPELRDFVQTLQQVYQVADGGTLSVHRGTLEGMACITTLRQAADGTVLLATKVKDRALFTLQHQRLIESAEVQRATFEDPERGIKRTLELIDGQLLGMVVEGSWEHQGEAFQMVVESAILSRKAQRHFCRTGVLDVALKDNRKFACYCAQVTQEDFDALTAGDKRSWSTLQQESGVGSVCGSCERKLRRRLKGKAPQPKATSTPPPSVTVEATRRTLQEAHLSSAQLDDLRMIGDPAADAVIADIFAHGERGVLAFNQLMEGITRHGDQLPTRLPAHVPASVIDFLALGKDVGQARAGWDVERLAAGARFHRRYALHMTVVLQLATMPYLYAGKLAMKVLTSTSRLEDYAHQRSLETAQMFFDVMHPQCFSAKGHGWRTCQKVRLLHASVRHMLLHSGRWDVEAYGVPINQEDMLGTLGSFSLLVLDGLKHLGARYLEQEARDFYYRWCAVGEWMGIDPAYITHDLEAAHRLQALMASRLFGPSEEGQRLARAWVGALEAMSPHPSLSPYIPAAIEFMVGPEIAGYLGLRSTVSEREATSRFLRRLGPPDRFRWLHPGRRRRTLFDKALYAVFFGVYLKDRGLHRPTFALPVGHIPAARGVA